MKCNFMLRFSSHVYFQKKNVQLVVLFSLAVERKCPFLCILCTKFSLFQFHFETTDEILS